MKYTLALDIGTGSAKCALFGSGLSVLAEADAVYDVIVRYPSWAEQNAEDWWKAASEVISRVISGAGVLASDITAIAVSGQAASVLLVDTKGVPLYPALKKYHLRKYIT